MTRRNLFKVLASAIAALCLPKIGRGKTKRMVKPMFTDAGTVVRADTFIKLVKSCPTSEQACHDVPIKWEFSIDGNAFGVELPTPMSLQHLPKHNSNN